MKKKISVLIVMIVLLLLPVHTSKAAYNKTIPLDGSVVAGIVNNSIDTYDINVTETGMLELILCTSYNKITNNFRLDDASKETVNPVLQYQEGEDTYHYRYNVSPQTYTLTIRGSAIYTIVGSMLEYVPVTNIELNKESTNIKIGRTEQLTLAYTPQNATITNLTYTSSNENIVKADNNGVITGVGMGKATVTVTANGLTKTCKVTVNKMDFVMESGLKIIDEIDKYVSEVPGYKRGKWTTSNKKIVKFLDGGIFEGLKSGKTKLTFKAKNKKYVFNVEVVSEKSFKKKAINKLKSLLKLPSSLEINSSYVGTETDKNGLPYISCHIDYSAMNSLGGYVRDNFYYYYYDGEYSYTDSLIELP